MHARTCRYDTSLLAPNALGLPVLARVGAADTSVPPYHTRRMVRLLAARDGVRYPNVTLSEIATSTDGPAGHWWWNTKTTNDGGVVFDLELRRFLKRAASLPTPPPLPTGGRNGLTVRCINPATAEGRGGVRVLQQLAPFGLSELTLRPPVVASSATGDAPTSSSASKSSSAPTSSSPSSAWVVATSNVRRFEVRPMAARLPGGQPSPWEAIRAHGLVIDGTAFPPATPTSRTTTSTTTELSSGQPAVPTPPLVKRLCYELTAGGDEAGPRVPAASAGAAGMGDGGAAPPRWRVCDAAADLAAWPPPRGPPSSGPARQVLARPFRIVVGTAESLDASERAELLALAV